MLTSYKLDVGLRTALLIPASQLISLPNGPQQQRNHQRVAQQARRAVGRDVACSVDFATTGGGERRDGGDDAAADTLAPTRTGGEREAGEARTLLRESGPVSTQHQHRD